MPPDPPDILYLGRSLNLENRSVFMLHPRLLEFYLTFSPKGSSGITVTVLENGWGNGKGMDLVLRLHTVSVRLATAI